LHNFGQNHSQTLSNTFTGVFANRRACSRKNTDFSKGTWV